MRLYLFALVFALATATMPVPYESEHHSDCPDMRGVLPETQTVKNLLHSFVEGLRQDAEKLSPCFNATMDAVDHVIVLYDSLGELLTGNTSTIFSVLGTYGRLSDNYEDITEDCDVGELWDTVEKLLSPMGFGVLAMRYTANMDKISAGLATLANCSADLKACGLAAGEMIRVMLEMGL